MATKEPVRNKYVGHRYVPKIMGEWDQTVTYEGLSIVLHQGNSYTSTGRVPVGIDISNETYWKVTGNYNAQIEQYRQDVKTLGETLDTEITAVQNGLTQIAYNAASFDLKGDGVTDNTLAFRDMVAAIPPYSKVIFPTGVYVGNFVSTKPLSIDFMESTLKPVTNDSAMLTFMGTTSETAHQLTENVKRHTNKLTLTTVPTDIIAGDLITLKDDSKRFNDSLPNVNVEIHKVRSISGNVITLDSAVHLPKIAVPGNVRKMNPIKGVNIENLKMEGTSSGTQMQFGVYLNHCEDITIRNVQMKNSVGSAVRLSGCYNVLLDGFNFTDAYKSSGGEGYGILITGGTSNYKLVNGIGRKMRHLIDSSQSHSGLIENVRAFDSKESPFVISHNSYDSDLTFKDCHSAKGVTNSNGFVYSGQGVENVYDTTGFGIKIIDCSANDNVGIRFDIPMKESIIQNFKAVKSEDFKVGTAVLLSAQNDLLVENILIDGHNRGILIESPSRPSVNDLDRTTIKNVTIRNVNEGVRFGFVKNLFFEDITLIKAGVGFTSTYNDAGEKLRYFTMRNISFEGISTPLSFSEFMLSPDGVSGIIENWRLNTTDKQGAFTGREGGLLFTDLSQLLLRLNMGGTYVPIRSLGGANVVLGVEPFPSLGLVVGQKIHVFNIGIGTITIPQGTRNTNKGGTSTILGVGETIEYIFYNDKWVQI